MGASKLTFSVHSDCTKAFDRAEKNPDLYGRDFFLLLPSSLAKQGQDLRIQHSLAALTRHPGRNEQKSRVVDCL